MFAYVVLIFLVSVWFLEKGGNGTVADIFSCQLDTGVPASESFSLTHFTVLTCSYKTPALVQEWLLCIKMKISSGFLLVSKPRNECSPFTGEVAPRELTENGGDFAVCHFACSSFHRNALLHSGKTCVFSPPPSLKQDDSFQLFLYSSWLCSMALAREK